MKNKFSILVLLSVLVLIFSCKKQEDIIYYEGGTEPVLSASSAAAMVLSKTNENNFALRFDWTNPNYNITTGLSSHDVIYILEADTTGANFTNPHKAQVSISKDLSREFTVKELNSLFGIKQLNLLEGIPHNIEFRIKSTLVGTAVPLYSNVVKMVITPYLDVAVAIPTAGTLWIVGDATTNGWSNPLPAPYVASQKFTKVSTTLYELTLAMPGGGNYKLIQENGVWGTQYHMLTGGTWSGGDFEMRDADPGFPGPPTAGNYKISVDFITGKYTVVKL
ncbi:MAG: SusE domain-containing protein [Bacteroidota bacterium]